MSDNFSTTLYFAIGYFSVAQQEKRDRELLASPAAGAAPRPSGPQVYTVHVTVFELDTGTQTLDINMGAVPDTLAPSAPAPGALVMERFATHWPPEGKTPELAFAEFLESADGRALFKDATAVQLFKTNVHLQANAAPP